MIVLTLIYENPFYSKTRVSKSLTTLIAEGKTLTVLVGEEKICMLAGACLQGKTSKQQATVQWARKFRYCAF